MASAEPESCVSSKTSGFGKSGPEVYAAASERDRVDDSLVGAVGGSDSCRHSGGSNGGSSAASCQQQPISDTVKEEINQRIIKLEQQIQLLIDIPDFLLDVPLECLIEETKQSLTYFLDPEMDIQTSEGLCKDYRGVAEWLNLEDAFQRYIAKIDAKNKFNEVLSMWFKDAGREGIPPATVGKLRECLLAMDRLDAVDTMAAKITRDAMRWKKAALQANVRPPNRKDLSWQLTRHDVLFGKETHYTACLMFADEDYGMAQIIMKLYKTAKKDSLFFLPQFDLKFGKYILNDTARVIDERCGRKVIFLLSKYFFASNVCQFAVYYTAYHGAGNGNLIPFHLTRDVDHVPNVLKGIAGVRWFRKGTREHSWCMLTDGLFMEKIKSDELQEVKSRIQRIVDESRDDFLCDPPYDEDVPEAGEPIEIEEPESSIPVPLFDMEKEAPGTDKNKQKWKLLKSVRKAVYEKLFGRFNLAGKKSQFGLSQSSPCKSKCPGTEMKEIYRRSEKEREIQKMEKDIVSSSGKSTQNGTGQMNELDKGDDKPQATHVKDTVDSVRDLTNPFGEMTQQRTGQLNEEENKLSDRSGVSESLRYMTANENAAGPLGVNSKGRNCDANVDDGIACRGELCQSTCDTNTVKSDHKVEKLKYNIQVSTTVMNENMSENLIGQESLLQGNNAPVKDDDKIMNTDNERSELGDGDADSLSGTFASCVSGEAEYSPGDPKGRAGKDMEEKSLLCHGKTERRQETCSTEESECQPLL
ncbi:uncharacterized protein LOC128234046 [Mya arenaria]|uniref:uncharacterized protein LOC128234046 n=1 Tax=Mya arenaria TaxID=6604 RepID=UPI0022E002F0|nr:uncharacterized protein LOC128234046 [Mya arenaria]